MAFLDSDEFRELEVTNSATEITDNQINNWLETAKDAIEGLVGTDAVTEVEAESDTDELRTRQFRKAQQKLTAREMMLFVASRYRSGGVQEQERDLNNSSQNTYEKFSETEKRRDVLFNEAMELLKPWFLETELSEIEYSGTTFSELEIVY